MTVQDGPYMSVDPGRSPVVDGDGPRYTSINETRNETNRPLASPEPEAGSDDLTFRFCRGASMSPPYGRYNDSYPRQPCKPGQRG